MENSRKKMKSYKWNLYHIWSGSKIFCFKPRPKWV